MGVSQERQWIFVWARMKSLYWLIVRPCTISLYWLNVWSRMIIACIAYSFSFFRLSLLTMNNPNQLCDELLFMCSKMVDETT